MSSLGKGGCTLHLQPLSCASNLVPRALVQPGGPGSSSQLGSSQVSKWRLRCVKLCCESNTASGPGQLSAVHAFGEAVKARGIKDSYLCNELLFIEAEPKQSVTKGRLQTILFIGDKGRENSLFDSALKVLQSYLAAAPYSTLFLDPYQPVQIQSSAQCHLSLKSFKKAECSWPVGLNSSLNLPTDGNFPD